MDKLKIGVVGLRFGATVIENLMDSDDTQYIELHGVYDLDQNKVNNISSLYHVKAYGSLEEMLADPQIDAVALYTPPTGRSDLILAIMNSGKHVITTKPFEADWRKAASVLSRSQELKKVIHINSPDVVDNALVSAVKKAVTKFDLGRPVGARCDVWVNYFEKPDGSWYDDPDQCPVAPIFRLGIYIINDLISLFGKARDISVFGSRLVTQRPTLDNSILAISFANGAMASIYGSFCVDDGQRYKGPTTLNYERGTFYYNIFPDGTALSQELLLVHKGKDGEPITEHIPLIGSPKGAYLWKKFYDDVSSLRTVSDEYAVRVTEGIRVLQAMKLADRQHRVISLDEI